MEGGQEGMIRFYKALFLMAACAVFLLSLSGEAEERKASGKGEDLKVKPGRPFGLATSRAPIDITSDTAEANQKENVFTFKGNVVAKQEDITLYANTVTIYYDPDTKGIKTVVAAGSVKVVQLDRRATGQKITFQQDENKVILEGDAVVRDGENVIRGDRVIYYIDQERSVVEGGKGGRVNTTITPAQKQ
jgi:lipopolysaccharide export system protein LptA